MNSIPDFVQCPHHPKWFIRVGACPECEAVGRLIAALEAFAAMRVNPRGSKTD